MSFFIDLLDIPNLENVDLPHSFCFVGKQSVSSTTTDCAFIIDVSPLLSDLVIKEENDSDDISDPSDSPYEETKK